MTTQDTNELDGAIARLYAEPLEDFIRQRDALAKELRAAGNREAAATVKALRKPSRPAWALNLAAGRPDNVSRLDEAVSGMLRAQTSGDDVRAALVRLREAVRVFAGHAGEAAERAGHGLQSEVLGNAVLALVGRTDGLDALRRGRLVEVPEGGGLDFLAALPGSLPMPERARPTAGPSSDLPAAEAQPAGALADARARVERTRAALRDAESRLRLAERRLREAEEEASTARREVERARREVESAAARERRAE